MSPAVPVLVWLLCGVGGEVYSTLEYLGAYRFGMCDLQSNKHMHTLTDPDPVCSRSNGRRYV